MTLTGSTQVRRVVMAIAGLAVTLLALSGCYRVDMAISVRADDTLDGTVTIAVSEELLAMTGGTIDELLPDDAMSQDGETTVEPFAQDGLVGKTFTLTSVPIEEFGDETMSLTHDGDTFVLDGTLDFSSEAGGESLTGGTVKVAFTFPGEVLEANGTIDAETNTVTWAPTGLSEPLEMHAVAKDGASAGLFGLPLWLVLAAGGALVLVVVALVVALVVRQRRSAAPVAAWQPAGAPAAPSWSPPPGSGPTPSSWSPPPAP